MHFSKPTSTILATAAILLSGCSALTPPASITTLEKDGVYWANYSADRRGSIIQKTSDGKTQTVRICSEPAPDTASDLEAQASLLKAGVAQASGGLGQHIVVLPGRDSTVLALRDALYSLCLLSINNKNIKPEQIIESYVQVISAITQYARAKAAEQTSETRAINWRAALTEEQKGFQKIANEDFKAAIDNFTRAETYYPSYHNVYEIGRELAKIQKSTENEKPQKINDLYKKISTQWAWGVPQDILEAIRRKIKIDSTTTETVAGEKQ